MTNYADEARRILKRFGVEFGGRNKSLARGYVEPTVLSAFQEISQVMAGAFAEGEMTQDQVDTICLSVTLAVYEDRSSSPADKVWREAFEPVITSILQDRDDARNGVDPLTQVWASRLHRALARVSPHEEPF